LDSDEVRDDVMAMASAGPYDR